MKQLGQFHEEPVFRSTDDQRIERLATRSDMKLHFFPLDEFALRLRRGPFRLRALIGNVGQVPDLPSLHEPMNNQIRISSNWAT